MFEPYRIDHQVAEKIMTALAQTYSKWEGDYVYYTVHVYYGIVEMEVTDNEVLLWTYGDDYKYILAFSDYETNEEVLYQVEALLKFVLLPIKFTTPQSTTDFLDDLFNKDVNIAHFKNYSKVFSSIDPKLFDYYVNTQGNSFIYYNDNMAMFVEYCRKIFSTTCEILIGNMWSLASNNSIGIKYSYSDMINVIKLNTDCGLKITFGLYSNINCQITISEVENTTSKQLNFIQNIQEMFKNREAYKMYNRVFKLKYALEYLRPCNSNVQFSHF